MLASFSYLPLDSLAQVDYNYLYPYKELAGSAPA